VDGRHVSPTFNHPSSIHHPHRKHTGYNSQRVKWKRSQFQARLFGPHRQEPGLGSRVGYVEGEGGQYAVPRVSGRDGTGSGGLYWDPHPSHAGTRKVEAP
jgi:hypothetical protein